MAITPHVIPALAKAGLEVVLEAGAGAQAGFADVEYAEKGAQIAAREDVFKAADVIVQVRAAGARKATDEADMDLLHLAQAVVGFLDPLGTPAGVAEIARRGVVAFAMELMPRIARAQSMDALSSMATIAGYKAVILAAAALPKMFPMMMTAAGTIAPARVFVLGAGVAGLQAIATARRLGAVLRGYDVRPAVKEQVESLGAQFVDVPLDAGDSEDAGGYAKALDETFYRRQRDTLARVVAESDVIITTAMIPGEKAPVLITREMIMQMPTGSVIVDLAAERGGNCELTRPGETTTVGGVTIMGPLNLPATVPYHASQMYAKNVATFLIHLLKGGELRLDPNDEITTATMVARDGAVVHPRVREALGLSVPPHEEDGRRSLAL